MRYSIRKKKTPPSGEAVIVPEWRSLAHGGAVAAAVAVIMLGGCTSDSSAPPIPNTPPLARMAVVGDFGHGGDDQQAVARAIRSEHSTATLDYLVTTGDNFYSDDVDSIWIQPYGWLEEESVEVLATWGNHDIETANRRELVTEHLRLTEPWYSRDLGPVVFIALDSNQVGNTEQLSWLETELEASAKPVVVAFHHPPHSCGAHGSDGVVRDRWEPVFVEHEVVLVLNGHEHDYERIEVDGLTHVVTGGGGRPLRPIRECPPGTPRPEAAYDTKHHFVLLSLLASGIDGRVISADSRTIDRFWIAFDNEGE